LAGAGDQTVDAGDQSVCAGDQPVKAADQAASASFLPGPADIIFCAIFALLVFLAPDFVYSDGSTGWHLVTGKYILSNGVIPTRDFISASNPANPWVPYEWLFDTAAAWLVNVGALNLLAVACASAISCLFLMMYKNCRQAGCHFVASLILVLLACFASSIHFLARPLLVTFFGVYCYQSWLEKFRTGKLAAGKMLIMLPLLMVIWANSHPAFLTGMLMVGVYLVTELFTSLATTDDGSRWRLLVLTAALALCFGASLLTPFGFGLYDYIFHYLNGSYVLANTAEFMPPAFGHQLAATCLEFLFAATVLALALSRKTIAAAPLLLLLGFGHAALLSARHGPLFAIIAVPIAASLFAAAAPLGTILGGSDDHPRGPRTEWKPAWQNLVNRLQAAGANFDRIESACRFHVVPALLVVASITAALMGGAGILNSNFSEQQFPTQTLTYLKTLNMSPAMGFNFDNWGGYLCYRTGGPVFIDDRLDYYGEGFYSDYGRVCQLKPGWHQVLEKYNIAYVLFPKQSALCDQLSRMPDWKLAASDPAADLYVRRVLIESHGGFSRSVEQRTAPMPQATETKD
jgi:hypothetical protein